MLDCILRLDVLEDSRALFVGEATESIHHQGLFGEHEYQVPFPAFILSREMWEEFGRPTSLRVHAEEFVHAS